MNIVFGGSFNPPTIAHKKIVEELKKRFNPENIIITPTGDNYHLKEMSNFTHRFNMCKLAFPKCIILNHEGQNKQYKQYKGTLDTLDFLSQSYDDLYFCMGADNLLSIKKWINYTKLLSKYKFIVFNRDRKDLIRFINEEIIEYKDNIYIIDFEEDISATKYRLTKDENLLNKDVYDYIVKNKLYE